MNLRLNAAAVLKKMFPARKWRISAPTSLHDGDRSRVSAVVCDAPVWFESSDQELVPATEAWAGAMLIPALHQQQKLQLDGTLDRQWFQNHLKLISIYQDWWDYTGRTPIRRAHCVDRTGEGSDIGLMFTCGADSFHSLLTHDEPIDSLIYVHGYDVPLEDIKRASMVESQIRKVAAEFSRRVIILRSNLRTHPAFKAVGWTRTHGAALAAVGHILSKSLQTLVISQSNFDKNPPPWGSHWQTDPLWGAGHLQINYLLNPTTRTDRVLAIADHPLVQKHLRVCWKNVGDDLNCSRCEKCLRTMVVLDMAGTLAKCQSFRGHERLADRIRDFRPLSQTEIGYWVDIWSHAIGAGLRQAVSGLLQRSGYFETEPFRKAG